MAGSKPEIGAKIVLDGAEEYQRSLKEVANAQKDLNKEMKLAESEFKKTGDAQQLYNEKVRLLNAQMDNQKKKLETAQKALKELSDKGVDKNSDLWRKWNGILLDSQTQMNNLQAELNSTTAAMKDTADATEQVTQATERATQETADYSETLKSIDKGVKFGNILNGLKIVKDTVGGVISTALRMGKALVMSQISGGDWAREIMMGAAKAGVSVEEYQARLYAQAVGGINTDAITEGVKKTTENLATTDTELLKLYNDLGISTRNADGTVRDATEAFWDSVDALKGIEDQTTRSIYAQKLLGDQYLELRGLVDLGSEGYEKLIEEGKASATVTEDSVKALSDMDAAVEKVNSTAQSLMHNINAELAPGFTAVAEAIGSTLTRFDEFLKTEEGKAVFENWNTSLANLAQTIQDTDFKTALEGIANVVNAIAEAFKIIIEGAKLVKSDVEFIADLLFTDTKPIISAIATGEKYSAQNANETKGAKNAIGSRGIVKIAERTIADEAQEIKSLLEVLNLESDLAKVGQALKAAQSDAAYASVLSVDNIADKWQSFIDGIDSGRINNAWASMSEIFELQKLIDSFIESVGEVKQSAESGGGSAMNAFNAAIEKGTADTKDTLKSGVTAAFSGFDSVFASMGAAHGAAYINALSAQMSRINSLLSLSPSYAYGGTFYTPAQSAYASPTSTANVSLYVGREKFGQVTTPIIDARMGADLMTMR
ncbi:MAG: phage tail tape measure protein [Clostridia bacterium]|nr:phage tail tape measure protein [Clostridia bacterium]